jgi:hypothetical protein
MRIIKDQVRVVGKLWQVSWWRGLAARTVGVWLISLGLRFCDLDHLKTATAGHGGQ